MKSVYIGAVFSVFMPYSCVNIRMADIITYIVA